MQEKEHTAKRAINGWLETYSIEQQIISASATDVHTQVGDFQGATLSCMGYFFSNLRSYVRIERTTLRMARAIAGGHSNQDP